MGFYFRIPLPGPFGYSKRIGGNRRRSTHRAPAKQPAVSREQWAAIEAQVRDDLTLIRGYAHGGSEFTPDYLSAVISVKAEDDTVTLVLQGVPVARTKGDYKKSFFHAPQVIKWAFNASELPDGVEPTRFENGTELVLELAVLHVNTSVEPNVGSLDLGWPDWAQLSPEAIAKAQEGGEHFIAELLTSVSYQQ